MPTLLRTSGSDGSASLSPYAGKRLTALGTSITYGANFIRPLAARLGATVTNLGVNGASLTKVSGFDGLIYDQIANIPSDTKVIFIEAGINEFLRDMTLGTIADTAVATSFYGALHKSLADILTGWPNADVFLLTPYGPETYFYETGSYTATWNVANALGLRLDAYQKAIRDVGAKFGVPVIMVGEESGVGGQTHTTYLADRLHLNTLGGRRVADYIASRLLPTFSRFAVAYDDAPGGIAAWDADDVAGNHNASTASWFARRGRGDANTTNLIQATAGNRPLIQVNAINGHRMLLFDGVNDFMTAGIGVVAQPFAFVTLVKPSAVTGSGFRNFVYDSAVTGAVLGLDAAGHWVTYAGSLVTGPLADTNAHIVTAVFNGASSSLRVDGVVVSTANPGSAGFNGISVGGVAGGSWFGGQLGSVRIGNWTLAQIQKHERELGAVAGITVS